jgi:mRNA export factor
MAFKFSGVKPAAKPSPNACEVTNDVQIPDGPSDTVSALSWSPTADFLAVSSWDNSVRVYEVGNPIQGRASYSHEGPALDVCWSSDGTKILSGGADNAGRMFDVQTGQSTQVAQHQAPIKSVRWTEMHGGLLVTGSWDKTIKVRRPSGSLSIVDILQPLTGCMMIATPCVFRCSSGICGHLHQLAR